MTTDPQPIQRKILHIALTAILWLATAALGMLCIMYGHDLLVTAIVAGIGQVSPLDDTVRARGTVVTIYNVTFMLLAIIWLAVVVGGADYHFRRVGQPQSWRVFAWVIGVELALLAGSFIVRTLLVS
jgi:hypothetical protein